MSTWKAQGSTVGEGQPFEKVVVGLPTASRANKTPGLETTAFSRAKKETDFAISDDEPLSIEQLMKIGRSNATNKRLAFEARLREIAEMSMEPFVRRIREMDPTGQRLFDNGFDALVRRYRQYTTAE